MGAIDPTIRPLLAELREALQSLYGERLAGLMLYGSYARGDQEAGSDIDVLVALHRPVRPGEEISRTSELLSRMSLENDTVISCAFVSEERLRQGQSPFLMNVRKEGVPV